MNQREMSPADIHTVALVGSGFIGTGWAIVFARAGREVRVFDAEPNQLKLFEQRLRTGIDLLIETGWLNSAAAESVLSRITTHKTLAAALDGADYVQESVPESLEIKRRVFNDMDSIAPPGIVLGSSVSTIPMTEIAAETVHPERCVVVHPTNPPHVVPFVEIVPGARTNRRAVELALALMRDVGQAPIVCNKEIFGFVINRLQFALEREAFFLAREGIASVEDIDRCITEGLGLRWALIGPFAVEETNAENIEADLTKFGSTIRDLMNDVCRPFDPLTPEDVAMAVEGVQYALRDRTHDQLLQYRNRLVLAIRTLKARESEASRGGTIGIPS